MLVVCHYYIRWKITATYIQQVAPKSQNSKNHMSPLRNCVNIIAVTCYNIAHIDRKATLLRVQVKNQRGVLQTHWVAADCVVDLEVAGGEGRLTPVQKDGSGTVGLGIDVVWRRWRWHKSIPHSWAIMESQINLLDYP